METEWPFGVVGSTARGEIELDWQGRSESEFKVYDNTFVIVRDDPVNFPDGSRGSYLSVQTPRQGRTGGVAMLPVFDGKIVLLNVFRHAPRRWELEIPRGFIDSSEQPEAGARRELYEECGVRPKSIRPLGTLNADSGLIAFNTACFWCELEAAPLLVGELIKSEPLLLPPTEIVWKVAAGDIRDGYLTFCLAAAMGHGLLRL